VVVDYRWRLGVVGYRWCLGVVGYRLRSIYEVSTVPSQHAVCSVYWCCIVLLLITTSKDNFCSLFNK
jgi:hypothetical protein